MDEFSRPLSVIIPSWNGQTLLERFLPSVFEAAAHYSRKVRQPVEIMVVDDGSTDGTAEWLARQGGGKVRIVRKTSNTGFSEASNLGIESASHPYVFLLNNDVQVDGECLSPLARHFSDPDVFAVSARVFSLETGVASGVGQLAQFHAGFWQVHARYDVADNASPESAESGWITFFPGGGASLLDRGKFLRLGGFNPILSPFGWEDVELGYRAWKAGYRVLYEPSSHVWHDFSSTIGKKFDADTVQVIYRRNQLLAHWLNLEDPRLRFSHRVGVLLRCVADLFTRKRIFWKAFWAARSARARYQAQGRKYKIPSARTEREILRLFREVGERKGVKLL